VLRVLSGGIEERKGGEERDGRGKIGSYVDNNGFSLVKILYYGLFTPLSLYFLLYVPL
jgi:hypothetical protein